MECLRVLPLGLALLMAVGSSLAACQAACPAPDASAPATGLASGFTPATPVASSEESEATSGAASAPPAPPARPAFDPDAPPVINQRPALMDFGSDIYDGDSVDLSFKLALGFKQQRGNGGSWEWPHGDCGGHIVRPHESSFESPQARGAILRGSLIVGNAAGKTKAIYPPRKGSTGWGFDFSCGDITGDGVPEVLATTATSAGTFALIVSLKDPPEVLHDGVAPFLEKKPDGGFVLHVRDPLLTRANLALPWLITPPVPRYLSFDGRRFVDRTRDEKALIAGQRAFALEVTGRAGTPGCAAEDLFCREQLASFFAATALLLGDEPFAQLPREEDRARARAILASLRQAGVR